MAGRRARRPASPETESAVRLVQGNNHWVGDHQIGVMNVYVADGSPLAQLSVHDPATGEDRTVNVRVGDELDVGASRYRVVDVVVEPGEARDWLSVAPIS